MKRTFYILFITSLSLVGKTFAKNESYVTPKNSSQAGDYLAVIGGCHDCHTPNFAKRNGKVPANDFLVGTQFGFKGPWGVSYPTNLRLLVQKLSEKEWVGLLKYGFGLPPMPWTATNRMSVEDLSSLYKYIKSLGPAGVEAPIDTPPNEKPKTEYIYFVPVKD